MGGDELELDYARHNLHEFLEYATELLLRENQFQILMENNRVLYLQ